MPPFYELDNPPRTQITNRNSVSETGHEKTNTNINANAYQLDTSFLTTGNYLIQMKTDEGVEVHKVIKK